MQNLYLNIVRAISESKARFVDLGLEPIRTVDMYNGQPDNPSAFEFVSPAMFIDYSIDWERGGAALKQGLARVTAHVITDPAPGSESWSDRAQEGLRRIAYYALVMDVLEGLHSDEIGSLYAISEQPSQTDYFDYHTITFEAIVNRAKGQKLLKVENVRPSIINE